jgi:hypothetical protein
VEEAVAMASAVPWAEEGEDRKKQPGKIVNYICGIVGADVPVIAFLVRESKVGMSITRAPSHDVVPTIL